MSNIVRKEDCAHRKELTNAILTLLTERNNERTLRINTIVLHVIHVIYLHLFIYEIIPCAISAWEYTSKSVE